MNIFLPSVLIILVTALLILATYLRARRREVLEKGAKKRRLEVSFSYDEKSWRIVLSLGLCGVILWAFAKVYPEDYLSFCPQIAYKVKRNGKTLISVPNFWVRAACFCFCKPKGSFVMEAEAVFKDLLMARAFVRSLLELGINGHDVVLRHNKIIVKWTLDSGACLRNE